MEDKGSLKKNSLGFWDAVSIGIGGMVDDNQAFSLPRLTMITYLIAIGLLGGTIVWYNFER
ncbi:MAG TPA: hypothetical protein VN426_15120 [Syntrophomonadaceae bacterium]|nr:hypothetical protein [Syntrophomonadaceae bacterium]